MIGVAGVGRWGKEIVRVLGMLGEHVETFDLDGGSMASFDELVETCDGVVIATPPHTHARMALVAAEAGRRVFVEKPLGLSIREVAPLASIGADVAAGHIVLTADGYQRFREKTPQRIESVRLGHNPGYHGVPAWWDLAVHDVAVCVDLLGAPDGASFRQSNDTYDAHLTWAGAEAHLVGNRAAGEKRWDITIDGVGYSPYQEKREPLWTELHWWLSGGSNLRDALAVVETLEMIG